MTNDLNPAKGIALGIFLGGLSWAIAFMIAYAVIRMGG